MKRTLPVLLLALAGLAACKDTAGPSGPSLSALTISPNPLFVGVGDTTRLSASGTKTDGTAATVTPDYKSSNTAVATVSSAGVVTGVGVGTTDVVAKSGGQSVTVAVNVLAAGNFRTFNVNSESNCSNPTYHAARLVATSAHALIYEDVTNPTGGFTDAEYQGIIAQLEGTVYPTDTQNFGTPTDIDGNGHFIVLYTRAVNDLTPVGASFIYGGFFHPRDVFPKTAQPGFEACPSSNAGEMFYMLSPDPTGASNGHIRSKAYVLGSTVGTIAHEFQHLINTSRRLYVNNADDYEEVWLDEGLAHVAEELNFYTASGLASRQNIGQTAILANNTRLNAFNDFEIENFGRFDEYLRAPASNAPYGNDDDLATRGAGWSLLRYLADRRGGTDQTFWFSVVNSTTNGLANLQAVLGTDPVLWARDWAVANYTDDAVPATAVFTHPSWNFRDVYANASFGGFGLQVQTLAAGTTNNSIRAGSAAYYKFGVAAAQNADVRVVPQGGAAVAGACTPVVLATVGAVQQLTLGTGVALCFPGGATGADYALIPFHASNTLDATFGITITASSVIATSAGGPSPSRATGRPLFSLDGQSLTHPWDGGMETRMRERAYRELRPMVHRFAARAAARRDVSNVVGNILYVNAVRIR